MPARAVRVLIGIGAIALLGAPVRAEGPALPSAVTRQPAATRVPLVSHRATYDVTLLRATGSKSPTSANGKVAYEFTGSDCAGYSQVFRQVTQLQPAEGDTRLSDMRSATYEDAEEQNFSFNVRTVVDGNAPEVVDGSATKTKSDVLAIRLSKPSAQSISVDNEVLFPTAHLRRIIAAAKAGQRILNVKVFDGSDDGKKIYDTTTIIGREITTPAADAPALAKVARWPVTISYFDKGRKDEEPAYTLGFELYEDGVSRALRFDYGDFVLAGELSSLDMLPAEACPH